MYTDAVMPSRLTQFAQEAQRRLGVILALSLVFVGVAIIAPTDMARNVLLASGATLLLLCGALQTVLWLFQRRKHAALKLLTSCIASDRSPNFVSDATGQIVFANDAARGRYETAVKGSVTRVLGKTVADPDRLMHRLITEAEQTGSAEEDVSTAKGTLRCMVHRAHPGHFVWRIDTVQPAQAATDLPELPMVLVGPTGAVLQMNDAAWKMIGRQVTSLDGLFDELPVVAGTISQINGVSGQTRVLVFEQEASAGRRVLYFLPPGQAHVADEGWNVFHSLPVPLLKVDPEGNVQAFNLMAANLIGLALDREVHLSEFMEGLGRSITDWLKDTVAGRSTQNSEFLRLKRMDKEVFVQVTLNRITEGGEPALIAVLSDATELKTLEAQFVQSQKMQAIGQLAGGVAHDFNNLLTAISGHCDLLLLRHDQGDPDFSDLVQINQNANRAAALVGQLLAFSRKQTLRPETLNMRDTLADLTHLLNRLVGEKVTLVLTHDPVLAPIRADKRQLEQVLMNLVVNARDAMPNGGEIRIETEGVTLKEPLKRDRAVVPVGEYVTVKVSDDGTGIPQDKQQKVFEPFFTTKRTGEGTGLGLSTAYGIVKQTGGFIFLDSTPGQGTTFTLYFPVLEKTEEQDLEVKPKVSAPVAKHGDGVILLVEDEAPVRAFASRALRLRGYTVLEADSAEAALKTLEDDTLNVDVFVTDVVMPGMDGPSWVREALKTRPDVRVVFVSGYAEDSFGESQTKIPNSVFLPKPFSLSDLTDTVLRQMH